MLKTSLDVLEVLYSLLMVVVDKMKKISHCSELATSPKDERFSWKQSPANLSQGDIHIHFCLCFLNRYNIIKKSNNMNFGILPLLWSAKWNFTPLADRPIWPQRLKIRFAIVRIQFNNKNISNNFITASTDVSRTGITRGSPDPDSRIRSENE